MTTETRKPIAYAVCTFGSPSFTIAEDGVPASQILAPLRYSTRYAAGRVAEQAVGTGSCSNARVARIYDADADPSIALAGGRDWEWADLAERREAIADAVRSLPAPCRIGDALVSIDETGYLVVSPADAVDGETIMREWPDGVAAALRLRKIVR